MKLIRPFIAIGQFHEFKLTTGEKVVGVILEIKKDFYLVAQKTFDAAHYPQIQISKNQVVWIQRLVDGGTPLWVKTNHKRSSREC